jgi:hypothetical protein
MRCRLLIIAFLVFLAASTHGRVFELEDGTSPNHRYRVQVAERGRPPHITYDIIRVRDGVSVHRVYSSYQRDEGELPDWSWNHATEAGVAWSADSRYVSIDEQVHRYAGEVLLAESTRTGVRDIKFPMQAVLRATKGTWDRYRIRHERGWISHDLLSLRFAGKSSQSQRDIIYMQVILRFKDGKAVVVSCHDITNET